VLGFGQSELGRIGGDYEIAAHDQFEAAPER
jgi:hypothetical protein